MPAVRGVYQIHPISGLSGLWLELSTNPPGTLTGLAKSAWPTTAGKTLANYQAELQLVYQNLCNGNALQPVIFGYIPPNGFSIVNGQLVPMIVVVTLTVQSPLPALNTDVVLSDVAVSNGACRSVGLGAG